MASIPMPQETLRESTGNTWGNFSAAMESTAAETFGELLNHSPEPPFSQPTPLGFCMREKLQLPRGERYELCRSVHAEANCIISAARRDMIGGTLYLAGRDKNTGELVSDACCCAMSKRMVINAGLDKEIVRNTPTEYTIYPVDDWIEDDDSLQGRFGY